MTDAAGPDGDGEALVNAFVDYFNARDLEELLEFTDPEVTSDFFGISSAKGLIERLGDFVLSYPGILLTRGELGDEPIAMAWIPVEGHEYRQMGFFEFVTDDVEGESVITSIGYSEAVDDPDLLLVEEPEASEMAEWEDWEQWETGKADDGED